MSINLEIFTELLHKKIVKKSTFTVLFVFKKCTQKCPIMIQYFIMNSYNKLTPKFAYRLASPHTWFAAIGPSTLGCVYCFFKGYSLSVFEALALILACILMQSSVNTLNDYFDYVKGTDSKSDNLERSDAVLVYEGINPKSALAFGLIYLAIAGLIGLVLILTKNTIIPLWIGLIGAACVFFYSGGHTPISYLPIGEFISGFVMGGLIPLGCVAVATGAWHFEVLIFALPLIISIGLILMSNNGCDIEKDIEANRKTLPVILGREKTKKIYKSLTLIWIALLWVLPVILLGYIGLLCPVLMHLFARKPMIWLMKSPLNQEHRVEQMKTILKANIMANGSYIVTIAIAIIFGRL